MPRLQIDRYELTELLQAAACNLHPEKAKRLIRGAAWLLEQAFKETEQASSLEKHEPLQAEPE